MPVKVNVATEKVIGLDEFCEIYRERKYNVKEVESLAEVSELFLSLSKNKDFLPDIILKELKENLAGQADNLYGPHVIRLGQIDNCTNLRANIWSSESDDDYKRSPDAFIYGVPHDHNFNFLTVGYWGPGYRSMCYEYDYESVSGFSGEGIWACNPEMIGLGLDEIMLYRAHQDIHAQFPPEAMSITLNVMESTPSQRYKDQYILDNSASKVSVVISSRCSPSLLEVAAGFGNPEIQELLGDIAVAHKSDFVRVCALRSCLRAEKDPQMKERLIRLGRNSVLEGQRELSQEFERALV